MLNYLFTNTFKGYVDEDGASDTGASLDGGTQQVDSNDEASDSDLSDVDPLDSDIEGVSMAVSYTHLTLPTILLV